MRRARSCACNTKRPSPLRWETSVMNWRRRMIAPGSGGGIVTAQTSALIGAEPASLLQHEMRADVASLIGRLRSSTFRLSTTAVSMSLTGSRFSSEIGANRGSLNSAHIHGTHVPGGGAVHSIKSCHMHRSK